ncbi:hypothetical protein N9051_02260 [Akkermansiaceae bacterium]|nr:hypothetical protein [Akkermansiaceae bacterium]
MELNILGVAGGLLVLQALLMGIQMAEIVAANVRYAPHRFSMLPAAEVARSMPERNPSE